MVSEGLLLPLVMKLYGMEHNIKKQEDVSDNTTPGSADILLTTKSAETMHTLHLLLPLACTHHAPMHEQPSK
jgi:hypothetical protein